jgi:hypothetical protein
MSEDSRTKYVVWGGPLAGTGEVLLTQDQA